MMRQRKCALCHNDFTPVEQGNFRYCPICRGKIARKEVDLPHAYWLTEAERTKRRAAYHRGMRRRKTRYARVEARRMQEGQVCYWCEKSFFRYKHKHQKFCNQTCFRRDFTEQKNLNGYFYALSKKGNAKLRDVEMETGVRPGTEKRRQHVASLQEARRNGKPWSKTGPKPKKDEIRLKGESNFVD